MGTEGPSPCGFLLTQNQKVGLPRRRRLALDGPLESLQDTHCRGTPAPRGQENTRKPRALSKPDAPRGPALQGPRGPLNTPMLQAPGRQAETLVAAWSLSVCDPASEHHGHTGAGRADRLGLGTHGSPSPHLGWGPGVAHFKVFPRLERKVSM